MNQRHWLVTLLLAGLASAALAQTNCPDLESNITYPASSLKYPLPSDQYAVQYQLGNGGWTDAPVRISYYGGTVASPFNSDSGYVPGTSFSFVSIPASANTNVQLRVTKLGSGFVATNNVSVRPSAKHVSAAVQGDGTVLLSTTTAPGFAGDQFLLWWNGGTNSGSVEALAFFLDPPYDAPTNKVKTITTFTDLTNLNRFSTLIFQGTVTLDADGTGDQAYDVNTNITTIFLAPGAWVQGKLRFKYSGGIAKRIYGPGVLDGSCFRYDMRSCPGAPGNETLSFAATPTNAVSDTFNLDGIVITDHNHALNDPLFNGTVNNVKSLGWNDVNGGFRLNDNTKVSNVFLRCGDDSLMMWGTNITVTNATVWQNYNGAVVNLGWGDYSPGDGCLIDGLYVVKEDWLMPQRIRFTDAKLDGQNDAIIASLMVPGTRFGAAQTPLFRNIQIEDPPRVLLSLKIVFPECNDSDGPRDGTCNLADLTLPSVLNLNLENLCSPVSTLSNSIGFLTVATNFEYEFPAGTNNFFTNGYTFTGAMNIGLTNVILQLADGTLVPLTSTNAAAVGLVLTNGDNVQVNYGFIPGQCNSCLPQLAITSAGTNVVLAWPTNFPVFGLELATNLAAPAGWKTNSRVPVVIGGVNVVTNPASGGARFYRLSQ